MDILPGILVVFGPVVILGAAIAGEACVTRLSRSIKHFAAVRALRFG